MKKKKEGVGNIGGLHKTGRSWNPSATYGAGKTSTRYSEPVQHLKNILIMDLIGLMLLMHSTINRHRQIWKEAIFIAEKDQKLNDQG